MARNFGKLPSEILGIENEVMALDFDRAANYRLTHYDNLRARDQARLTGIACGMAFNGEVLKFDDEEKLDLDKIPEAP